MAMDPETRNVKSVYILRMGAGLDQLLASELTKNGIFTVTTDPQKADALFTDSLGEGFEKKFEELYPPPAPPKEEKDEKEEEDKSGVTLTQAPMQKVGKNVWGSGKGTIFLVERKSRNLLWSMNRQTKGTSTPMMVEQARKIVGQLKKELAGPGKP